MGLPQRQGRTLLPELRKPAKRAECSRDTVYEAIKALEFANVLSWVNRIVRDTQPRARPVRPMGVSLAHHPHQQRLCIS